MRLRLTPFAEPTTFERYVSPNNGPESVSVGGGFLKRRALHFFQRRKACAPFLARKATAIQSKSSTLKWTVSYILLSGEHQTKKTVRWPRGAASRCLSNHNLDVAAEFLEAAQQAAF